MKKQALNLLHSRFFPNGHTKESKTKTTTTIKRKRNQKLKKSIQLPSTSQKRSTPRSLNLSDASDDEAPTPTLVLVESETVLPIIPSSPAASISAQTEQVDQDQMEAANIVLSLNSDSDCSSYTPRHHSTKKRRPLLKRKAAFSSGRFKAKVWEYFTVGNIQPGQRKPNQICNYCNRAVSAEAPRLRKHISKFPKRPDITQIFNDPEPAIAEPAAVSKEPTPVKNMKQDT